jgi:SNF2 family DNA or RNA helicase
MGALRGKIVTVQGMNQVPHSTVSTRPVFLLREGAVLRLAFSYRADLIARVKELPYAAFDPETRSWTVTLCTQTVEALRAWFHDGLLDVSPDDLLAPGERLEPCPPATLTRGSVRRPYLVRTAQRDDHLYMKLKAITGAAWEKEAQGVSYPPGAYVALEELVRRGVIADPEGILTPASVVVAFDGRVGRFAVRGDERAAASFTENFPEVDVMAVWKERGLDVAFADSFTAEVYAGEMARAGDGLQPAGLTMELYPYQRQDVAVAAARSGVLIASEPGLGKTAVAIGAAVETMTNRKEAVRTIVVVPGAVRTHWQREIVRFTGCDPADVVVVHGEKKKREAAYQSAREKPWLVVHYDVLHLDKELLVSLSNGAVVIADEVHRIKNPTAARTKVMRLMANRAARRIGLSGTPVENDPGEWYSILSGFCIPGLFGGAIEFLGRYCYPGRFGGYEGARNLAELRDRSRPHYVRRRKADVATHLPPLRVQTVVLDPDPGYANALKRAHREAREEIASARRSAAATRPVVTVEQLEEIETGAEMTAVGMLRLLCCSPRLVANSDAPAARALIEAGLIPDADGPKVERLLEMAESAQSAGERLVAFTSSIRMANLLAERLTEAGVRHVLFTGATSSDDRDAAVTAFTTASSEENPGPTVFVSTDAGAEGLNLGRHCSTLVNLDMPWTASRAWQRANRIHRVDNDPDRRYLVVNLTLRGTLEEGILRMVEAKADLSDAILGETGGRRAVSGRRGKPVYLEALETWSEIS